VFRETRTPVSVVFDNLEVGASIEEIMEWFHLSHEQVVAVCSESMLKRTAWPWSRSRLWYYETSRDEASRTGPTVSPFAWPYSA